MSGTPKLISVRLPHELRIQLEQLAKKEYWSINQAIVESVKLLVKEKLSE